MLICLTLQIFTLCLQSHRSGRPDMGFPQKDSYVPVSSTYGYRPPVKYKKRSIVNAWSTIIGKPLVYIALEQFKLGKE